MAWRSVSATVGEKQAAPMPVPPAASLGTGRLVKIGGLPDPAGLRSHLGGAGDAVEHLAEVAGLLGGERGAQARPRPGEALAELLKRAVTIRGNDDLALASVRRVRPSLDEAGTLEGIEEVRHRG